MHWLHRLPGPFVVGAWLALLIASFVTAALVDVAVTGNDLLSRENEAIEDVLPENPFRQHIDVEEGRPENPFRQRFDDRAKDRAAFMERDAIRAGRRALGAMLAWLLAFGLVTVGTGRWLTVNRGWIRVRSWHGGKLLILSLMFAAAVFLFGAAASVSSPDPAGTTLLFATGLLIVEPATTHDAPSTGTCRRGTHGVVSPRHSAATVPETTTGKTRS